MTSPKIVRNGYCVDPEDRVVAHACPCCARCWLFVASRRGAKNGTCPFGGPFAGFEADTTTSASTEAKR